MPDHRRLSLRTRFAISMAVAFSVLCLLLVLFINLVIALLPGARLVWVSLSGLVVAIAGGGGSAYWLAGIALRPLSIMQETAQGIHSDTLATRLHMTGPHDELRALADSFDAMLDRLERAFTQQARFVADAAHELRTPLATLRINLEVVADDPHATVADYRSAIATSERALTRLEQLVHDLLILATEDHIGHGADVDLGALVTQSYADILPLASASGVSVSVQVEECPHVMGNPTLLGTVLRNVLDNAVRYNHPAGHVTLTLCATAMTARITVADTGMGIPSSEQDAIFGRFYRLDQSRARASGGFGLGLALAHHIMRQHDGTIRVESLPGQGSCFFLELPWAPTS